MDRDRTTKIKMRLKKNNLRLWKVKLRLKDSITAQSVTIICVYQIKTVERKILGKMIKKGIFQKLGRGPASRYEKIIIIIDTNGSIKKHNKYCE